MKFPSPRIEFLAEKKLVGKRLPMSWEKNRISELWRGFMPLRNSIPNQVHEEMISMAIYASEHFQEFDPNREFEKWAAVEVSEFGKIPDGLESFTLSEGNYAVFEYKGSSADPSIFQYIYGTWIPNSNYVLDNRPHFEVLGKNYRNNDPESEEEIWIPIKLS